MAIKRIATAQWTGSIKDGKGQLSAPGGVLNHTPYSFASRFEGAPGTNPEELIAAAHAGCFTMAFTFALGNAGITPASISTEAAVTLNQDAGGFTITAIHLTTVATVPGGDAAKIRTIAEGAKTGCPISKALAAVKITMDARVEV